MDTRDFDEMAFLASFFLEPDKSVSVIDTLEPEHFSNSFHQTVFKASRSLYLSRGCFDTIAVAESLGFGQEAVSRLMEVVSTLDYNSTQEILASRIYDRWARSQIKSQAKELAVKTDNPAIPTPDLCEKMEDIKGELGTKKQVVYNTGELCKTTIHKLEGIINGDQWGIKTGFEVFDESMGGCFDRGDLHVISARPGNGKTSFAIHMMIHSGLKIYFASTEMDESQVTLKIVANLMNLDSSKMRYRDYIIQNKSKIVEGMAMLENMDIITNVSGSQKASGIRLGAKRAKRILGGLDMIVVDHLQFLRSEHKTSNRADELSESMKVLKETAKELDVACFVLSQLNRGQEDRGPVEPPRQRDLKGSGAIEEDTASIVFLHYPAKYDDKKSPKFSPNLIQLITSKSRHSESDKFTELYFKKESSSFRRFDDSDWDSFNFSIGNFK